MQLWTLLVTLSYNELFNKCAEVTSRLDEKIKVAEKNNQLRSGVMEKLQVFHNNYGVLLTKLNTTQMMLKEINIASREYRERRKDFITNKVESALALVFQDDYKVDLTLTPYGDRMKARLKLYTVNEDGTKSFYIPKKQNGGLCRQTISLSSGLAIAELLNCHIIFMDEALNGGDSESLQQLQKLITDFTENEENQIILNEHNGSLYKNISCRLYNLAKIGKGQEGYVTVVKVEDLIGENLDEIEIGEGG